MRWTDASAGRWVPTALGGPAEAGRPVAYLSFALSYYTTGPGPAGFRLLNVLVHAVNAVLVALLARAALSRLPRPPGARDALWMSLAAGFFFALHPLQIQAVTYIVQRMTSLATGFYLAALLCWWRGREARGPRRAAWWSGAAGAWGLALGAKEITLTGPAAVWLVEWFFFRGLDARFARRSALVAGLPLALVGAALAWLYAPALYADRPFSFEARTLTELRVVVFYLSLVLWPLPSRLNLLHEFPLSQSLFAPVSTLLAALALVALVASAVLVARRAPLAAFGVAWLLLHLALESFALPLALAYEHRMYLPMVGVALLFPAVWFPAFSMRMGRAIPVGVALLALLGAATWTRNQTWRDEVGFWADAAAKSPGRLAAHNNHGLALARAGRSREALDAYARALALQPDDPEVHDNRGSALLELGERELALASFREALRLDPYHFRAHYNLGRALVLQGESDAGLAHLEEAVRLAPHESAVWNGLGAAHFLGERYPEAARAFERALRLDPGNVEAQRNLALARARLAETRDTDAP